MNRKAFVAAVLAVTWPLATGALAQDPQQPPVQTPANGAAQLDDVVVVATDTEREAETFVASVAAAAHGREPAVWRRSICVGVGGMSRAPARALVDRVSDWGHSLGLEIGAPGCRPTIFIVATDNGDRTARELVARRPRDFVTGAHGTDLGRAALERFQSSGRLIRWWHVSLPVNEETGAPAVRLPGQAPVSLPSNITSPADLGPAGMSVRPSRISSPIQDDLQQVIIVLDSDALSQATFPQVADFISMVALAQVDPDANPPTPSILNLFQPGVAQEETLSAWDQAYLRALYGTYLGSISQASNVSTVARAMAREKEHGGE